MLIQEMHNKIELRIQKMGSHIYDWIQSPQVDSYINDQILSFIKNKVNTFSASGKAPFQRNIKSLEDLKTLIVRSKEINLFTTDSGEYFKNYLPGDFLYHVESVVYTSDKCKYPTGFPSLISSTRNQIRFDLPYNSNNLSIGAVSIINLPGFQDESMKFIVHNLITPVLSTEFGDIYFNGLDYLFIKNPSRSETFISVDTIDDVNNVTVTQYNFTTENIFGHNHSTEFSPNRLRITNQEEFSHYFDHPFAKSESISPSGVLYNNLIEVHTGKRFIVSKVDLTYIRKPLLVDLSLNVSCDLPESTHQEIVDNVVLDILESIESQRLQSKMILNQKND